MTFDAGSIEAHATLDKSDFIKALNELKALGAQGIEVPLKFSTTGTGFASSVASAKAAAQALAGSGVTMPVNLKVNPASVAGAAAATTGLLAGFNALQTGVTGGGGGWWGFLTGRVPLFAGLGGTIAQWHLLGDAILEVAAVWGPALVAMGAAAIGLTGNIQDIVNQFKTFQTVSQGLAINLPHLSDGLTQIQNAVKPQAYALLGDALTIVNSKTGELRKLAVGASTALDELASRFTVAMTTGGGFGTFLHNAVPDIYKLGNAFGNLFGALGNILKEVPGYANVFLNLGVALTHIAEVFTGSIGSILQWGLALHGAYIYAGLAVTGIVKLGQSATTTGGLLNTWGLALAGAGKYVAQTAGDALFFAKNMGLAAGATSLWIDTVGKIPGWGWAAAGVIALGALAYWAMTTKSSLQQFFDTLQNNVNNATTWVQVQQAMASATRQTAQELAQLPKATAAVTQGFETGNAAAVIAQHNYDAVRAGQQHLNSQSATTVARMMELTLAFGSQASAVDAVHALNLKLGTVLSENSRQWAIDEQTILGYNQAIIQMAGYTGGPALAAQNALNLAASDQTKAIQQITQTEGAYFQTLVGGEQAFYTFLTDLGQIYPLSQVAGASLNNLKTQSIALGNSFYGTLLPAGQKQIAALQTMQVSTKDLTTVVATIAAQELYYAGTNQAAQSSIMGMINNALGPGTVSLQNMNQWVSTNSTSLQGYQAIVGTATTATSQLSQQVQNLANQAFSAALLKSSGLTTDLQGLATALVQGQTSAANLQPIYDKLVADFMLSGSNADDAKQKAAQLITEYGLVPASVVTQLENNATTEGGYIQWYTKMLDALNGKHVSSYIDSYYTSHYYAVYGLPPGSSAGTGGTTHAAGGLIRGGTPGKDSVHALLMPGEVVVPTHMVAAGAIDHLRGALPGFAGGGMASSPQITHGGSSNQFATMVELLGTLIQVTKAIPKGVGDRVGGAINGAGQSGMVSRRYPSNR